MACSQGDDLVASCVKERSSDDDDSANLLTCNRFKRFIDRCIIADSKILNLQAEGPRCLTQIA